MVRITRPDYTERRMSSRENVEDALINNFWQLYWIQEEYKYYDCSAEMGVINLYL